PRPKAHLRVAAQLSSEEVSPDLLTEAEVHRRFKSIPFVVPQPSSSTPTTHSNTTPSNSPLIPRTPSSPFHAHKPTPNRFPEQVDEDQVEIGLEEKSSDSDGPDDHHSFGSGPYHSIIMAQEDDGEDQKIMEIQKWKTFRGSGSSSSSGAIDQTRSGKRRCQEPERYDHGIFKRRAVSPSTSLSSSCIGSPILNPSSAALILPNHLNSSYNNMLSNNNNNNNINPINLSKSNRSNLNQNNSVTSKSKMDEDCSSNHQVDTLMLNQ
ncbi:hypothetical protein O181_084633, partial [Austropuccinia psidii MF-1]|nr:hypothetical protein [Austropuccinia psidii MF-1]